MARSSSYRGLAGCACGCMSILQYAVVGNRSWSGHLQDIIAQLCMTSSCACQQFL
jgi:hypothetical protein